MATEERQIHVLGDYDSGQEVEIVRRSGRGHTYIVGDDAPMPSVTSLIGHVESDGFGIGLGWGLKVARENGGDLEAPKRVSSEAIEQGNLLHSDIDSYVSDGIVNEMNPAFTTWLREVGSHWDFTATEVFLYHPGLRYGGTVDAISNQSPRGPHEIWDWKTKDPDSYAKNGGSLKDHVQLAAYAEALRSMGSIYAPQYAKIAYVMRDGSGVDVVDVDIDASFALFLQARKIKEMASWLKPSTKPYQDG
jgi:hypothetical protein